MQNNQNKSTFATFLNGIILGGLIGILFAPKKGEDTRNDLKKKINEFKSDLNETKDDFKNEMESKRDSVVSNIEKVTGDLVNNTHENIDKENTGSSI